MPPPIPAPESMQELLFPLLGINLSMEFELQPQGTCAVGSNVRGYEPLTSRARGGSRPGLSKYINQQVSGPNKIQHLNYVVDPDASALITSNDPAADTTIPGNIFVPDPSTNNNAAGLGSRNGSGGTVRSVRGGGSGVQPNRTKYTPYTVTPPTGYAYSVQIRIFQVTDALNSVILAPLAPGVVGSGFSGFTDTGLANGFWRINAVTQSQATSMVPLGGPTSNVQPLSGMIDSSGDVFDTTLIGYPSHLSGPVPTDVFVPNAGSYKLIATYILQLSSDGLTWSTSPIF
jgi:hypothetical protein